LKLEDVVEPLMRLPKVVVGVDFDGTLAPLVSHPDLAAPLSEAMDSLRRLAAAPNVIVAVVSGRALADLRARLGDLPGAILIGEHGNDYGRDEPVESVIDDAIAMLREVAGDRPEVVIETKPRSVSFHYRNLSNSEAEISLDRIRAWAADHEVSVLEGKKVVELSIATRDKGIAVRELADGAPIVYFGDDMTDESVFETLGPHDVGVKVGPGPTAAAFRVEDVNGVARILNTMALASG
jgi:trehalose 6-phosphate phosphatase